MPMKLVTSFADLDGEKCMYSLRYNTRLLAFARYARFSNISTTDYKWKERKKRLNQSHDPSKFVSWLEKKMGQ